jgi:prepilin-type N-terminal cleavage/methylation domain-containing protein/prepilin-type processing-associated H-X9-DG protein
MHTRDGFTLVELLTVLAIIALLAAIAFPVYAGARGEARQTVCLSNMKQLATSFFMYAQDYDGHMPRHDWYSTTGRAEDLLRADRGASCWWVKVMPYLRSEELLRCPAGEHDYINLAHGVYHSTRVEFDVDYGINMCLAGGYPIAWVREPASIILLVEQEPDTWACWWNRGSATNHNPWQNARHEGGSNYVFCDGHAAWRSGAGVPQTAGGTGPDAPRDFRMELKWP